GGDEGHLERRDQRLALAVGGVRQLDPIAEATADRAAAVRHLRHRGREVERQGRAEPEIGGGAGQSIAARPEPGQREVLVTGDLDGLVEVEGLVARRRVVTISDPESIDEEAGLLGWWL